MTNEKIIKAVLSVSVETGSLACLGCGHEHNCGIHGCAILREAADRLATLVAENAKLTAERDSWKDRFETEERAHDIANGDYLRVAAELKAYEDAKEQGRLVELPCKVGDTAWKIKAVFSYFSKPMEDRVERIIMSAYETLVCCTSGTKFAVDSIGKTVFLTRAEAEAALGGVDDG